jgi:hypothetical protein
LELSRFTLPVLAGRIMFILAPGMKLLSTATLFPEKIDRVRVRVRVGVRVGFRVED